MKITHLKTTLVDVPLAKPIATAIHSMRSVGCVLVELVTDEGLVGESYAFTLNGVRLDALETIIVSFAHQVEGRDPHDVAEIGQAMWREMNPIGHGGFTIAALAAIDTACWDIVGKAANKPLHHLFGACREEIKTYASGGLWLSQSIDECLEDTQEFIADGFCAMKMRIGKADIAEDVERVAAVRKAIGDDIELMVDANQCLSVAHAVALGRALAPYNLAWFEEPVDYQDLSGHGDVRRQIAIPVASGETEYTHVGMRRILEAGAVDVLMPDLQRVGGLSEFRRAAAIARDYQTPFSTHIFTEQSLCIAGAESNCISVEHMPWFAPLFNEQLELVEGSLVIPNRPGTGFTFNHERIARFKLS